MRTEKRANSEQERGKGMTEELRIRGSMGDIYGVLTVPEGQEPVPLIILSHGFGGNHLGQQDYAAYFAKEGFATYNFDFCGGGGNSKSAGSMLEMTVLTEAEDLRAIAEHFQGDARFSCILLWGASQGGFVSALVSAGCPETFRAVVLEFPAIVLQDDARKRANPDGSFPEQSTVMGWTISYKYNEAAVSFDLYEKIGQYTGPVLILHGDQDSIVPLRYSQKAREIYPQAELVIMPGQGHGFTGESRLSAMKQEAAFFARYSR